MVEDNQLNDKQREGAFKLWQQTSDWVQRVEVVDCDWMKTKNRDKCTCNVSEKIGF